MLLCLLRNTRSNHNLLLGSATIDQRKYFLQLYQCDSSEHKRCHFVSARNNCKHVLKEDKFLFADRMRHHVASNKFGSCDYWRLCYSALNKSKSSVPSLFPQFEVLTSADKAECLLLHSLQILPPSHLEYLLDFAFRTESRYDMYITLFMVSAIIFKLDPHKVCEPDGILAIVLKKCTPELASDLCKLYNKFLSFPAC